MEFFYLRNKQKWISILIVLLMLIQYVPAANAATKSWSSQTSATTSTLFGVSYGGGQWIAVGDSTTVVRSTDGVSWTKSSLHGTVQYAANSLYDVLYTGTKWITVGSSGDFIPGKGNFAQIYTSNDGVTWASKDSKVSGNESNLMSIAQNGNTLVAVGNISYLSPVITTSSDGGETWTNYSAGLSGSGSLNKVTFGAGVFVAVGDGGSLLTSPNGVNWTKRNVPTQESLYGAVYSNGKFMVVGQNVLLTSTDGVTWTQKTLNLEYPAIASSGGEFVAVGTGGQILSSIDGNAWIPDTSGTLTNYWNVNYGNGKFVAVGDAGQISTRAAIPGFTPSTNANLSNLTLSAGTLTPSFSASTTSYTTTVTNVTTVDVTATVADSKATLVVNGNNATSGNKINVPLAKGANTITVKVTAEDGVTTKTYTLTVTSVSSSSNSPLDPFNNATTVEEMRTAMEQATPLFTFDTQMGYDSFFSNVKNDKDYVYLYMLQNRPSGGFPDKNSLQTIIGDGIEKRSPYMILHESKDGASMLLLAHLLGPDYDLGIDISVYESFIIDEIYLEADQIGAMLSAKIPADGFIGPDDLQSALDLSILEYVNESLATDKSDLAITFATGDDENHVTQDISLPSTGDSGPTTTITWTSSQPQLINADGTVTRPTSAQGDTTVTLTANIDKNGTKDTKTFSVLVKALNLTDAEAVGLDKSALEIGYSTGDNSSSVTQNLILQTAGQNGTTISWSSSSVEFVAADGAVTRPTYLQGDQVVTLTATIMKNGAVDSKTFTVTLPKMPMSDSEAVSRDKAVLAIGYTVPDTENSVTNNIILPTSGQYGTAINWFSSNPNFVSADGTVIRPTYLQGDQVVTLTATISKNGATDTKTFTLTLPKLPISDAESVMFSKSGLEIGYRGSDSASSVTQDVLLNTSGQYSTTISWISNSPSFIAADGTVTRPTFTQGDQEVTLTATITRNGVMDVKQFTLQLPKLPINDAEAVAIDKANLEIGYSGSDNANSVTNTITLKTFGQNGTTISWSSSSPSFVAADGTVIRPSFTQGDQVVSLNAFIVRNGVTDTKIFTLTLPKLPMSDSEAVALDKSGLKIGYSDSDSASSVTQNVILSTTGQNGTTINWFSNSPSFVAVDGTVTRPSYTQGDKEVILTATIMKNGATDIKTFHLTLPKLPMNDMEAVAIEKSGLEIGFSGFDNANSVTQNLFLKTTGENSTIIAWSSSSPGFVAADGTVTRPSYTQGDQVVTLVATIVRNGVSDTKAFTLKLPKLPMTDAEAVTFDKASLEIGYSGTDNNSSVTQNVLLKTSGQFGTTISWTSSYPSFVAADGTVTRPSYTQGDQEVTLTATISKNGVTDSKTFTIALPKLPITDAESVSIEKEALNIIYTGADSASSVTENVVLGSVGLHDTTITWSTSSPSFVAADGTVTRPSYTQGDQTVALTATISKNGVTDTKSFTLFLPHLPMSDAEAVGIEKAALEIGYNGVDKVDSVSNDIILNTAGQNGTSITWSSSEPGFVTADGKVTQPNYKVGNLNVTVTATITKGAASDTKTFVLTLISTSMPPVKEPEILVVDVVPGDGSNGVIVQTTISRSTDSNGDIKDTVTFTQEKAQETVEKLTNNPNKTARIVLPDTNDKVTESKIIVPKEAVKALVGAGIDLEIFTENGSVLISNESYSNINEDLYFRIVPVKNEKESDDIENRAKQEPILQDIVKNNTGTLQVLGRPMEIETNMQNRLVTLTFPVGNSLPSDPAARKEILDNLVIFIEHSDGTKEVLQGKVVDYKGGNLGIEFDVSKFSTFTMLYLKGASDYFTKDVKNHMPYIKGYADGNFHPNAEITRAQMAAMLSRNLGITYSGNGVPSYVDTPKDYWAFIEIELVKQAGIMIGSANGQFNPQDTITRAQMATIAYRWVQKECKADANAYPFCAKVLNKETISFKDISDKHWAKVAIEVMAASGIMQGYEDNTFNPEEKLTRAQAVKVLNRLFKRGPLNGTTNQTFKDVPATHWAYKEIEEAAQAHSYKLNAEGAEEIFQK